MKINFSVVMKTLKGEPIKNRDEQGKITGDLTLADIAVNSLLGVNKDEMIDGRKKQKRYNLAKKADVGGELELKPSEVSDLIDLIGKSYPPLIVGQAFELLGEIDKE